MRTGMGIVAVAGPLGNLILGIVSLLVAGICNALGLLSEAVTADLGEHAADQLDFDGLQPAALPPPSTAERSSRLCCPLVTIGSTNGCLRWGGAIVILLVVFGGPVLAYVFEPLMFVVDKAWTLTMEVSA